MRSKLMRRRPGRVPGVEKIIDLVEVGFGPIRVDEPVGDVDVDEEAARGRGRGDDLPDEIGHAGEPDVAVETDAAGENRLAAETGQDLVVRGFARPDSEARRLRTFALEKSASSRRRMDIDAPNASKPVEIGTPNSSWSSARASRPRRWRPRCRGQSGARAGTR
jgi:hypothetical protein